VVREKEVGTEVRDRPVRAAASERSS